MAVEEERERRKRGQTSRSWKGADYPWRNNRLDVHGHPVNGNHFKRSRPQCVYLANVKFTRGKRRAACTLANTLLPLFISCRCFLRVPSKIGSFCRARSSALGRGSCSPIVNLWLFSSQVLSVLGNVARVSTYAKEMCNSRIDSHADSWREKLFST